MAVREKESAPLYVPASFTAEKRAREPRRERTWRFWLLMTGAAVLVVAWVAVGAFFVGQGTRPSEGEVADRIADRVSDERFAASRERARALKRQESRLTRRWEGQMKRMTKRAYGDGRSNGYAAGRSAGYAAGAAAGRAEGAKRARRKARRHVQHASYAATCLESDGFPFVC